MLQKLITFDRRGPAAAGMFATPRVHAHPIARDRLIDIAEREELPLDAPPPDAPTLILLPRPDADVLAATPAPDLLLRYWRYLFHARVHAAVTAALAADPDPRAAVQRRVERLGRTPFNEARFVLHRERYLPSSAAFDDAEVYARFAALYLEFTHFDPGPLPWFFPSVANPAQSVGLLSADVDAAALVKSTKLAGAADRLAHPPVNDGAAAAPPDKPKRTPRDLPHREALLAKAVEADAVGNDVRAAILRMQVYRASGAPGASRDNLSAVYADALKDLDQLATRLKAALGLDDSLARQWRAWLVALLDNAAAGWWNAEGRLLYDLQKACVHHEREIYSVNVIDYLLERGRRPLRRPQPGQRLVLTLKALRSALRRTARARLSPHGRAELQRLLRAAIENVEHRLREFLCPGVTHALQDGGLHPRTAVEHVAHAKLTEELLDEVVASGYLTFGALRDAVSRNQMKLNDLTTREDFTRGDQLLRIDRRLEDNLDYVYRRGEIYLRGFHRLSSLFFATAVGRFVTKALILPLGGAYLVLEALDHSVGALVHKLLDRQHVVVAAATSAREVFGPPRADMAPPQHDKIFNQWWLMLLLGVFLFGVVNSPRVRAAVATFFRHLFRALGAVFVDAPRWVINRPVVQAFVRSRFARGSLRYVVKPLGIAAVAYVLLPRTLSDHKKAAALAAVFLAVNLLLNSRAGRVLEQAVLHALRTTFARFTWDVLANVARRIVQWFQTLLEAVDRLLYAVDELLRFRTGQARSTVAVKAVLGVFWFYIAYVTRFVINLLIEPQINPIKHFPVVTVSHKMIIPLGFPMADAFRALGMDAARAGATATFIVTATPGVFGFLAWEFKENWKLYHANRSKHLKPVRVGSHGESVAQFLRPGFHSGTIPKLFQKLRRAQLKSDAPLADSNKHLEAAHHVEEALEAFLNREFLAQLNRHPLFKDAPVSLAHVTLATTRIGIDLTRSSPATSNQQPATLSLSFEQRAGWIVAGVDHPGWLDDATPAQTALFAFALAGLYKLAGVDLVREHLRALFAPHDARFDFRKNDLVVWPAPDFAVEAAYDLTADRPAAPRFATAATEPTLPILHPDQLLFRHVQLPRETWVQRWDPTTPLDALPVAQTVLPAAAPATPPAPPAHPADRTALPQPSSLVS
jgi:hypothetical protein